jgi:hypothetical protein
MRRNLIHLALALVLVPATVAMVLALMLKAPSVLAFPKPTHRVAVAVDEAMRSELASVDRGEGKFANHWGLTRPDGRNPVMGEVQIPEDYPAFWSTTPGNSDQRPSFRDMFSQDYAFRIPLPLYARSKKTGPKLVTLNEIEFDGRSRDGLAVTVTVRIDTIGQGSIVDFHGNSRLARILSDRIADHLAHPRHKHESPEDRAALMAFFGAKPPDGKAPAGKVDPALQQSAGSDGLPSSVEDQ